MLVIASPASRGGATPAPLAQPEDRMPNRRVIHLVAALVVLAPLACATKADRDQQQALRAATLARVPANAAANALPEGLWWGTITGEPPIQTVGALGLGGTSTAVPTIQQRITRTFDVEVTPWRDSARVAFVQNRESSTRTGRM